MEDSSLKNGANKRKIDQSNESSTPKSKRLRTSYSTESTTKTNSEDYSKNTQDGQKKQVFSGMTICIAGKLSKTRNEIANIVREHGGTFTKHVSVKISFFVTTNETFAAGKTTSVQKAQELGIPIVTEEFLYDCIAEGRLLKFEDYAVTGEVDSQEQQTSTTEGKGEEEEEEVKKEAKSIQTQELPSTDSSYQLIEDLRGLVGTDDNKPMFADATFDIEGKKFYAPKAVLCVRSDYFKKLLLENKDKKEIKIENVTPDVFYCTLQFLCSGDMTVTECKTAVGVHLFAETIKCPGAQQRAGKFLEERIKQIVEQKDITSGVSILNDLVLLNLKVTSFYKPLKDFILENAYTMMNGPDLYNISQPLMKELLESDSLNVNEVDLFEKVIKWAVMNLSKKDKQNGTQKADPKQSQKEPSIVIQSESKTPAEEEAAKKENTIIVKATELREHLKDLLPLILFEHMSQTAIFKNVESKKIFRQDELLDFCKAAVNVKNGDPYTILGRTYTVGRKKRRQHTVTVNKGTFNYVIKREDLAGKLFLPPFEICGSQWFVCVQIWGKYLSIYLYNKIIYDGGTLPEPIYTTVHFTLISTKGPQFNKVSSFTKEWQKVKAWGYSNFQEMEGLFDPANGWCDKNGQLRVEVSITKVEDIKTTESA